MFQKLFKSLNFLNMFVFILFLGMAIYTILTYKSLIYFEKDIYSIKAQLSSLSTSVNGILQQHSNERNLGIPQDFMSMFSMMDPSNTTVLYNENKVSKNVSNKESSSGQGGQGSQGSQGGQEETDQQDEERDEQYDEKDETDSVTSNEIQNLVSNILSDDENDNDLKEHVSQVRNEHNKEEELSVEKLDSHQINNETIFNSDIESYLKKTKDMKSTESIVTNNSAENIESFIQGHFSTNANPVEKEKNNFNIETQIKKIDDMPPQFLSDTELSKMKYEDLRHYLKHTFNVSSSRGTKNDLITRIKEQISLHVSH